jgi:hypothetical protein
MTEEQWLASADAPALLRFVTSAAVGASWAVGHARPSDRKLRLYACACFRHGRFSDNNCQPFDTIEAMDGEDGTDDLSRNAGEFARRWAEADGKYFAPAKVRAALVRDVVGNPFRPSSVAPGWRSADVRRLAQDAYQERAFAELPILADALEDARCTDEGVLAHLRSAGPHVRGCWALDLILGKG